MLVSPKRVHELLSGLLGATDAEGPHTALLITPQGQLLAKATVPDEEDDIDENGDADGEGEDEGGDGDEDEQDDGDEDEDDEPYLEGPERLRLLLGLASQEQEDGSQRVECELGRLFMCSIPLPEPEPIPAHTAAALPNVKPPHVPSFLLVLNGSSETPWSELAAKSDEFLGKWNF